MWKTFVLTLLRGSERRVGEGDLLRDKEQQHYPAKDRRAEDGEGDFKVRLHTERRG